MAQCLVANQVGQSSVSKFRAHSLHIQRRRRQLETFHHSKLSPSFYLPLHFYNNFLDFPSTLTIFCHPPKPLTNNSMAPKAASKAKEVKAEPSTPKPKAKAAEAPATPKKTPTSTVRKPKMTVPPRNWVKLSTEDGLPAPIDVKFDGFQQAAPSAGGFSMNLKLDGQNAFTVVKTVSPYSPQQSH